MFENIKRKIQERIERNAVKVQLSWSDKDGNITTEDVILKRTNFLPIPYIGSWLGDWQRIQPVLDEDGKLNILNTVFGGWKNFVKLLIVCGIVACAFIFYSDVIRAYEALQSLPCVQTCINPIIIP